MLTSISGRLNTLLLALVALMAAAIIGILATRAGAGPLDPPGTPGPTSGVLRPGTPITSLPFTITQPGNYYLTGNLTMATAGNGITISADNVTLDLGGFTIDGSNTGSSGVVASAKAAVVVEHGRAEHWTQYGFNIESSSNDARLDDVSASFDHDGISTVGAALTGCSASSITNYGVYAQYSTLTHCHASGGTQGFRLAHSTLSDCTAGGPVAIKAYSAVVERCEISFATVGIDATDGSTIIDNSITDCGSNAIQLVDAGGSTTVKGNTLFENQGSGIYVSSSNNRILANNSASNSAEGLDILGSYNTVDENSALENSDYGIFVALGTKNTVVRNSATGNFTANYLIASGNNPGPVETALTATHPWSNTQ